MKIKFYPVDIDHISIDNKTVIRIFGRTEDGKKIVVYDSYKPYFWIICNESLKNKLKKLNIEKENRKIELNISMHKKKFFGRDVTALKVSYDNYSDFEEIKENIKEIRDEYKKAEVDIDIDRKYLIDKNLTPLSLCSVEGEEVDVNDLMVDIALQAEEIKPEKEKIIENPRVLAFDIEVYNKNIIPNEEKDEILMVSFAASDGFKKVITWKEFKSQNPVEFVKNEKELLNQFKRTIREYQPDFLIGYFTDGFDFPYLKTRASKLNVKLDIGADGSSLRLTTRAGIKSAQAAGYIHFDVFKFIRFIMGQGLKLDSYGLDNVAKELLNERKTKVDMNKLYLAWDKNKDLDKYVEYNLQDSLLALKLFNKIKPNIYEITKLISIPPGYISRMSFGQLVEWYMIRRIRDFNEIVPNRPKYDEINERAKKTFEGAFVYEPEPGLYENIAVFDFTSLYPTIIAAHNICPSTLTETTKNVFTAPEIEVGKKLVQYKFDKARQGFFSKIIKDIIEMRKEIKKELKKDPENYMLSAKLYTLKILANSFYGYLAFQGARWYSLECAASTAAFGRDYIKKVIQDAKDKKFEVIYGDTDSLFVVLGDKSEKDALRFSSEINKKLPEPMELELDKIYKRGIFVSKKSNAKGAKKKYALIDDEDNLIVRGFETIRGDWSIIAKETQNKILEIILKEANAKKAVDYVKEIIKKVRERKIPLEKMAIQKQVQKNLDEYEQIGPHVAVARRLEEKGVKIVPGTTVSFVINEGAGSIRDRARLIEESRNYDIEYYINNQIIPSVSSILEVLGFDIKNLGRLTAQKNLGDF